MDDAELLERIQTGAICVDLDFKSSGDRDKTLAPQMRKDLIVLRDAVRNAFFDNSIEFGFRRLILAGQFEKVVMAAGAARQSLKTKLAEVTPEQAEGFHFTMFYEPVPRGDGFKMLPPAFAQQLVDNCEKRQVENYYEGMDSLLKNVRSSVTHYVKKLEEFDTWAKGPSGGKSVVLRTVVATRPADLLSLMQVYNIMQSERYLRALQYAGPVIGTSIDDLRKNTEARERAMQYGRAILTELNGVLGEVEEEDGDADADEQA